MNRDIKTRDEEKELRELVKQHPSIEPMVRKIIEALKTRNQLSPSRLLYNVYYKRPDLAPAGYWGSVSRFGWTSPPESK
jgi:hypothetical protein